MKMRWKIIGVCLLLGIFIGLFGIFRSNDGAQSQTNQITSYEQCVAAGYQVQEIMPERCITPNGQSFTKAYPSPPNPTNENSQFNAIGSIVCLPHKNTSGPQTMECAIGLKTDEGIHYGLNTNADFSLAAVTGTDKKVSVNGTLKTTDDTLYDIVGTVHVSNFDIIQ